MQDAPAEWILSLYEGVNKELLGQPSIRSHQHLLTQRLCSNQQRPLGRVPSVGTNWLHTLLYKYSPQRLLPWRSENLLFFPTSSPHHFLLCSLSTNLPSFFSFRSNIHTGLQMSCPLLECLPSEICLVLTNHSFSDSQLRHLPWYLGGGRGPVVRFSCTAVKYGHADCILHRPPCQWGTPL